MDLSQPLAERGHDALVTDHRAHAEADGAEDTHPPRRVFYRFSKLLRERFRLFLLVRAGALGVFTC